MLNDILLTMDCGFLTERLQAERSREETETTCKEKSGTAYFGKKEVAEREKEIVEREKEVSEGEKEVSKERKRL